MPMPFVVVEFEDEVDHIVEAVPSCWLQGNSCVWPEHLRKKPNLIRKLINEQSQADENYTQYCNVKIIKEFGDIREARVYAKKLAEGKESSCTSFGKGKRKKFKVNESDYVEYSDASISTVSSLNLASLTDDDKENEKCPKKQKALRKDSMPDDYSIYSQELIDGFSANNVINIDQNVRDINSSSKRNTCDERNENQNYGLQHSVEHKLTSTPKFGKKGDPQKIVGLPFPLTPICNIVDNCEISPEKTSTGTSNHNIAAQRSKSLNNEEIENFYTLENSPKAPRRDAKTTTNSQTTISLNAKIDLLLKQQSQIIISQKKQERSINYIMSILDQENNYEFDNNIPDLPLKTEEDFKNFENYLEIEENFRKMVTYLKSYVSKDLKKTVYNILSKIFDLCLAVHFNYCGTKPKNAFKNTITEKTVYYALKSKHKEVLKETFKEIVMVWFKSAPQREKKKGNN